MSKSLLYMEQQLGAAGFVLLDADIAYRLRRDLWPSRQDCGGSFNAPDLRRKLVERAPVLFRFHADGCLGIGGAFSAERLVDRIRETCGLQIEIELVAESELMQSARMLPPSVGPSRRAKERLAKMRAIAAQEPPMHDCPLRRQILSAREELGAMESR